MGLCSRMSTKRCRLPGSGNGGGHDPGLVHRRELAGSVVRRMGPQVREMGEPRFDSICEPAEEAIGEKRRCGELDRPLVFESEGRDRIGEVVAMAVQPVQPRQLPAAHVEHGVEPGQNTLVGRQPGIVGVVDGPRIDALVGVAEQRRFVPGPAGSEGDVVEPGVERRAVGHARGCSSGRCRCTTRLARASTVRPARSVGPAECPVQRGDRAPASAPRGARHTTGSRPGTDRG